MYRPTEQTKANARRRRNAIAEAARQQLAEGGFRSATVKAVAKRAQCSTGLIYQYFPNAEELLKGAFAHVANRELAIFRAALDRHTEIGPALDAGIEVVTRRSLAGPRQADALLFEAVPALVEEERLLFRRKWASTIAVRLDQAIITEQLPAQNTQLLGTAITGAVVENLLPRLHDNTASNGDELAVDDFIAELQALCRRLVGISRTTSEEHYGRVS